MAGPPKLALEPELPQEIIDAADGKLVLFVGAGISRICGLPNWAGLADKMFEWLLAQDAIDFGEIEQLKYLDPRTKLSIAHIICKRKKLDFNLEQFLRHGKAAPIYDFINSLGCPCVTTNYDNLLQPVARASSATTSSAGPAASTRRVYDPAKIHSGLLNDEATVIHLHGAIDRLDSPVATTGQYLELYDRKNIQVFLKTLFEQKTVLFLGYGLAENEILEHILRRARVQKENIRRRFVLQGYFEREDGLYRHMHAYYQESFGVHVSGFIRDKKDFAQQEEILKAWSTKIDYKPATLADAIQSMDRVLNGR